MDDSIDFGNVGEETALRVVVIVNGKLEVGTYDVSYGDEFDPTFENVPIVVHSINKLISVPKTDIFINWKEFERIQSNLS